MLWSQGSAKAECINAFAAVELWIMLSFSSVLQLTGGGTESKKTHFWSSHTGICNMLLQWRGQRAVAVSCLASHAIRLTALFEDKWEFLEFS